MSVPAKSRQLYMALFGVPLLFLAVGFTQARIDSRASTAIQQQDELLLSSGRVLKNLSLGYDALLADIYWTRVVQYYGARLGKPEATFDLLWPLLDITTTLDPKLVPVYRFGSIFLSEPRPIGAGRTDLATELVKRGIAANPDKWILSTDLGFLYYWRLKDYPHAAAAYLTASRVPGAPVWTKLMAGRIAALGGSIETSRMIWSQIYDSTSDPTIREHALDQLRALKVQQDEGNLGVLAEQYRQRFNHYPTSSKDIFDAGLLRGIPVDPAGFPYAFNAAGKATVDARSPMETPPPTAPPSQSPSATGAPQ